MPAREEDLLSPVLCVLTCPLEVHPQYPAEESLRHLMKMRQAIGPALSARTLAWQRMRDAAVPPDVFPKW